MYYILYINILNMYYSYTNFLYVSLNEVMLHNRPTFVQQADLSSHQQ